MEFVIRNCSRRRKQRIFKSPENPLNLDDEVFIRKYRINKDIARLLIDLLKSKLKRKTRRNHAVSCAIAVMTSVRLLATGSFQSVCGDISHHMISQPTVSRIFKEFLAALLSFTRRFISFPSSEEDLDRVRLGFYQKYKIPNVVGVVDGTHVPIMKPFTQDSFCFMNRKGFYSLNVQIVCDHKQNITNVVAKWPGSSHDSWIFKASQLYQKIHTDPAFSGIILGDQAYGLTKNVMTPLPRPSSEAEKYYNNLHKTARNIVERTIGLLKMRFRILDLSGGFLQYEPRKVAKIVIACVILHNLCIEHNVPMLEEEEPTNFDQIEAIYLDDEQNTNLDERNQVRIGEEVRKQLISRLFQNRNM